MTSRSTHQFTYHGRSPAVVLDTDCHEIDPADGAYHADPSVNHVCHMTAWLWAVQGRKPAVEMVWDYVNLDDRGAWLVEGGPHIQMAEVVPVVQAMEKV